MKQELLDLIVAMAVEIHDLRKAGQSQLDIMHDCNDRIVTLTKRLRELEQQLDQKLWAADRTAIEAAFRDGWEEGWESCRIRMEKAGSAGVSYSADDFNPDWDGSRTKMALEEE